MSWLPKEWSSIPKSTSCFYVIIKGLLQFYMYVHMYESASVHTVYIHCLSAAIFARLMLLSAFRSSSWSSHYTYVRDEIIYSKLGYRNNNHNFVWIIVNLVPHLLYYIFLFHNLVIKIYLYLLNYFCYQLNGLMEFLFYF